MSKLPVLSVLYRDDHLIAVNKPPGIAVHRGFRGRGAAVVQHLRDQIQRWVYPVHRLDRATSGVLLLALDPGTAGLLGVMFERGEVHKTYLALVRGTPPASGTIDHPIARTEGGSRVSAVTDFRTLARSPYERCSLVEARPRTGRMHQIRKHLKHIDHPIVGDVRYGDGEVNRQHRRFWAIGRLALHASRLELVHPRTLAQLALSCTPPDDLADPLRRLGLPLPPT